MKSKKKIIIFILFLIFILCNSKNIDLKNLQNKTSKTISFLSVKENMIVNEKDEEVRFRGIQIDFGSARGDISNEIIQNNPKLEEIFDRMLDYVITEDDIINIKKMGANCVRLSLNTYKDFENDSNPFSYNEKNFLKLDKIIEWAEKHNLYLIISMRQSPGGHNSSPHSGNNGKNQLWLNSVYQKRLLELWKKIADRYKNNPIIAGYDLLNEPEAPDKKIFNKIYSDITKAIREKDKNHIIFLEGNTWAKQLDWINPPADKNVAFSIHFYTPGNYSVNGNGEYPSVINGINFNQDALKKELKQAIEYAIKLKKPIWIGEFGAMTKAKNHLKYDKDVIQLFEEFNLNWTYWHYKNLKGKTDTQAIYYSDQNNKFLNLISTLNKSKTNLSFFKENEIFDVLKSLETKNFYIKQDLKNLISKSLIDNKEVNYEI